MSHCVVLVPHHEAVGPDCRVAHSVRSHQPKLFAPCRQDCLQLAAVRCISAAGTAIRSLTFAGYEACVEQFREDQRQKRANSAVVDEAWQQKLNVAVVPEEVREGVRMERQVSKDAVCAPLDSHVRTLFLACFILCFTRNPSAVAPGRDDARYLQRPNRARHP
eukprot:1376560-Rhodomonas_salina.1